MVNVPTLKGIHYAIESGRLAAEATFAALRSDAGETTGLTAYDEMVRSSFIWSDLHQVRDMRQVFGRGLLVGGALAAAMTVSRGHISVGRVRSEPDAAQPLVRTDRASRYPTADGKLVFDKLSSVFASGNRSRDDQPDHIRLQRRVSPLVAELWALTCPAQVYMPRPVDDDGLVTVDVAPSNCVQCGAITAKGGRLTPPEGGSGPEYTLT
jgi:electron-transferring-flavoprotein dehydrogenase